MIAEIFLIKWHHHNSISLESETRDLVTEKKHLFSFYNIVYKKSAKLRDRDINVTVG